MRPAGLAAFAGMDAGKSAIYSYEQRQTAQFTPHQEERFRNNAEAWRFFEAQPPWYRKAAAWWVTSAKREETRTRRLATLILDSAAGRTVAP